jgi:hypothetical protein
MGLGGPVWHASAAPAPGGFAPTAETRCRRAALAALDGVGDAELGEWHQWSGAAYHVRRRLSVEEQRSVGDVVDVRGTPEAARRLARIPTWVLAQIPPETIDA